MLDGLLALSPVGPLSPNSAIALGVGTLFGSFVLRGFLRWLLAPGDGGRDRPRDRPRRRRRHRRPPRRRPTRRRACVLVGYLSSEGDEESAELPLLG